MPTTMRFDGSADFVFVVQETSSGRCVRFALVNEETIGPENERTRVFTWASRELTDFVIRVTVAEADFKSFDMRAEIIDAAVERAKLELQDPESPRPLEWELFA